MPSPFPGMDPYLENVIFWRSVHTAFIAYITAALNDTLPDAFVARIEGRSYIMPNLDLIYPDAILVRAPSEDEPVAPFRNITVLEERQTTATLLVFEYTTQEIAESYVSILSVDDEEVVTVIALLSPTNKAPESTGREEYIKNNAKSSAVRLTC